ncbi:hypothetical protein CRU99_01750 [Malaciobacter mytili]|uniref:hypothetical protein n=1 Tax=Malaciobacter mytili TaxID=603050 RepID=UPI00100BCE0B|nr:hypothetical protein [Malaciobacter mytili]RXI48008.1 hypothetical protein CRU99_01750 [Malaciobacter mytili]
MISELVDVVSKIFSKNEEEHSSQNELQKHNEIEETKKDTNSSSSNHEDMEELKTKTDLFGNRLYDDNGQKIPTMSEKLLSSLNPSSLLNPPKEPTFKQPPSAMEEKGKSWEDIKKEEHQKDKSIFSNPLIDKIEQYQMDLKIKDNKIFSSKLDLDKVSKIQEENQNDSQAKSQNVSLIVK